MQLAFLSGSIDFYKDKVSIANEYYPITDIVEVNELNVSLL